MAPAVRSICKSEADLPELHVGWVGSGAAETMISSQHGTILDIKIPLPRVLPVCDKIV